MDSRLNMVRGQGPTGTRVMRAELVRLANCLTSSQAVKKLADMPGLPISTTLERELREELGPAALAQPMPLVRSHWKGTQLREVLLLVLDLVSRLNTDAAKAAVVVNLFEFSDMVLDPMVQPVPDLPDQVAAPPRAPPPRTITPDIVEEENDDDNDNNGPADVYAVPVWDQLPESRAQRRGRGSGRHLLGETMVYPAPPQAWVGEAEKAGDATLRSRVLHVAFQVVQVVILCFAGLVLTGVWLNMLHDDEDPGSVVAEKTRSHVDSSTDDVVCLVVGMLVLLAGGGVVVGSGVMMVSQRVRRRA